MRAKYKHDGFNSTVYDQVICEDNIVVTVRTYRSSFYDYAPDTEVKVCPTNSEARRIFHSLCSRFEDEKFDCVYKEDSL